MGARWLDQSEWDHAICDDLRPVLKFLEERYGLRIAKVHLDMKAIITDIYLDGETPLAAMDLIQSEFSANANLRFWPNGAVSCSADWTGISWNSPQVESPPLPPKKPWWKLGK